MGRIRQGIIIKRKANNKKAKYTLKLNKTTAQTAKNGVLTTKYTYSKVITRKKYSYV